VGNLNLILVIALSQAWLHEEVALFQHFGTLEALAGKSLQDMEAFHEAFASGKTWLSMLDFIQIQMIFR
jgi:hypothetical protein